MQSDRCPISSFVCNRLTPFHGGNTGSNPVGDAKILEQLPNLPFAVGIAGHDRVTIESLNGSSRTSGRKISTGVPLPLTTGPQERAAISVTVVPATCNPPLLTICGFLIFALTMTFVSDLPGWAIYATRAGFLVTFGTLWWVARDGHPLNRFRPVFFAYFTAVIGLSLGFFSQTGGLSSLA